MSNFFKKSTFILTAIFEKRKFQINDEPCHITAAVML